jgi:hypothetical protein
MSVPPEIEKRRVEAALRWAKDTLRRLGEAFREFISALTRLVEAVLSVSDGWRWSGPDLAEPVIILTGEALPQRRRTLPASSE